MTTDIVPAQSGAMQKIEAVLIDGDLEKLSTAERVTYYRDVCASLGLNHLTKPFQYIKLNGKLVLYATKGATDQIARNMGISIQIVSRDSDPQLGTYAVIARATDQAGRFYDSEGIVSIKGLQGENLCNALMKAATKARRRAVLGMGGLGMMDETELETVRDARPVNVNMATGEIVDTPAIAPVTPIPAQPNPDGLCTRAQRTQMAQKAKAQGVTMDDLQAYILNMYGTPSSAELTFKQAQEVLEWLDNPNASDGELADESAGIAVLPSTPIGQPKPDDIPF